MIHFNDLLELDNLAKQEAQRIPKKREIFEPLLQDRGKHFTGIVGPRGVGKTILLKQLANTLENSFYLSMDSVNENDLFDIAKNLTEKYNTKTLLIDEIHFLKDYDKHLKKIYDFLNIKIIFTSSVALALFNSSYDLSRRVLLIKLYPFSFREYIAFKKDIHLPNLTFDDILNHKWTPDHLQYEFLFDEYLQGGLMPFALDEPDIYPLLENILQKTIHQDIPSVASLKTEEIPTIEKTLKFIGKSEIDGINYSSISRNVGITKYKAEAYISLLEKAFIINALFPAGTNVLKEPKILLSLPYRFLYQEQQKALGGIREDFFIEMMRMKNISTEYLKTKRGAKTPDFLIKQSNGDDIIVEIGGKGKGREQFKGIDIKKKLILTHPSNIEGIKRPLFLMGFL